MLISTLPKGALAGETDAGDVEPYAAGWSFFLDNDLFAFLNTDQQYTGGIALELAGRRAVEYPWSLDPVLGFANGLSGFAKLSEDDTFPRRHSFTIALAAFTPEDIAESEPIFDDHPYASLVTIGNTRQSVRRDAPIRYRSSFLVGLLGTNIAQQVQNAFHDLGDSERAQGWNNQISAGGELTFHYTVSRQEILARGNTSPGRGYDWRFDTAGSLGYVTEVSLGSSVRWGRLGTQWWTFDPAYGDYIHLGAPMFHADQARPREWYVWFGAKGRARLYNALLEGQFRDSPVTFSRSELRVLVGELGTGITADIPGTNLRGGIELRYRTREIADAAGEAPIWGRIMISRSF